MGQVLTICYVCGNYVSCRITGRYDKICTECDIDCVFYHALPDRLINVLCNKCKKEESDE